MSIDLLKYSSELKITKTATKAKLFCILRKKWLFLTPEEIVRQTFILYAINELGYSKKLISIEKQHLLNKLQKRSDLLIYNNLGKVEILIECKRPEVEINQNVLEQAIWYNSQLQADFLVLTNGITTEVFRAKPLQKIEQLPIKKI